jgi:DNA-binding NarL/FixJ family response regulator
VRSTYQDGRSSAPSSIDLTRREFEVLRLLAAGLGSAAIAERLVISTKTVSSHVQRVLAKLGAHSRGEAVAAAYRERLIDPAEVAELGVDEASPLADRIESARTLSSG